MKDDRVLCKNQIDVVICQIRFNVIFGIDEKIGAIQDDLRQAYPVSSISPDGEPNPQFINIKPIDNYCFESEDGCWKVNITRGFLSLSSSSYKNWSDFKSRLEEVIEIVRNHMTFDKTTRIGLRYINAIRRSRLIGPGEALPEWKSLLEPHTLGIMGRYADRTKMYSSRIEYEFEGTKCCTITGQISFNDDGEYGFLIDNDVYTDDVENADNILTILDGFNERSYLLFESMITSELKEMMR